MATDTKQKPPASPNTLTQSAVDKKFSEITANLDPEKKTKQNEDREYVLHQLSQTAGERVRKLALDIRADSKLREEVEKLAHELEASVPVLARKARTEDALVTQIEALVDKTERSIRSMAKEEEEKEKKKHEKEEEKEHKLHPHQAQKPAKADKTPEEKAKEKLDEIRAEIRGEKPAEKNATIASLPEFTPERDKQLREEQNAYVAGTVTPHVTEEGIARVEKLRAEARTKTSETTDRVAEIRKETERLKTESGLSGPTITPEGAARAEKLRAEMQGASPQERKAFAQGSVQPHARANEIRKETQILKTKQGVNAASTNADVTRAVKMEEIRKRRLQQKKIGPTGRPITGNTSTPPRLSISARPLAGKVRRQTGRFSTPPGTYYETEYAYGGSDTEDGGQTSSGKVAHGPSDNNDQRSDNSHGKMRMAREGLKAARSGFGGGGGAGRGGAGLGNILRGGLGGGAKTGGRVAAQVAARASVALMANPWFWAIVVVVLIILFFVFIFMGETIERDKQAQNCAAPVETMKVTVTGPAEATAGQILPYQITVTDTVPNQEVTVVATIPQGISTIPADITSSWTRFTLAGNTITWKATENLPPNSLSPPNFNFTVSLKATAPSTNAVLAVDTTPLRTVAAPVAPAPPGTPVGRPGRQKSSEELMRIYGGSAEEVEAQLVSINFQGKNVRVHRLVQGAFEKVNAEITAANTGYVFRSVGTFNWRTKNCPGGCTGQSTHSFGITMDINPDTNPYTTANTHDIPPAVADAFKRNGFDWGGDWQPTHDWMHFEYVGEPGAVAPGTPGGVAPGGSSCPPGGASGGPVSADYIPPSADNCGGKYTANMTKNPTGKNFGDPTCNFTKDALLVLLRAEDPPNADFWWGQVVRCESSYNPNAYVSQAEIGTPDPGGAWGLYQMGSSTPGGPGQPPPAEGRGGPNDRGDVPWVMQTKNAVSKGKQLGGTQAGLARYWACAR